MPQFNQSSIKAMVADLLTGARGTFCAESVRSDAPLMKLLGFCGAPEEAQLWRMFEDLGEGPVADAPVETATPVIHAPGSGGVARADGTRQDSELV